MIRDIIRNTFSEVLGTNEITLLKPKHDSFGDYSVNVLQLDSKPSQNMIATFCSKLETYDSIDKADSVGAFINVFVSKNFLASEIVEALRKGENYGNSDWGSGKTWEIEHTSPNPNKAMHLGHLRNNVTGMALVRMARAIGIDVFSEAVDNNRGIAIAKLMWGYKMYAHTLDPKIRREQPGTFVSTLYVMAAEKFENDEEVQKEIKKMVIDWENGDEETLALWEKALEASYESQDKTLTRLDNQWDHIWHEHEHWKQGQEYVIEGLHKNIFTKTDEGTVITQLEKDYNLPDTVLLKSDGTSLYITQDIALTDLKNKKYTPDLLHWVVGPEQSLALKQMFAVCEQLGIIKMNTCVHIPYGYMRIKGEGKMSSRKGNVILIDDVLDTAVAKAESLLKKKTTTRETTDEPELQNQNTQSLAESVGVGAVKYSLLKIGRTQDTEFDYDESIQFEGNSGPYLQYTYARLCSLLDKALSEAHLDITEDSYITSVETLLSEEQLEQEELLLLRKISQYHEVLLDATISYNPHVLCTYLYDLAQAFSTFYEKHHILTPNVEQIKIRVALVYGVQSVLGHGLKLLGIDTPNRL